jgi:hypothetical protein
MKRLSIVGLVVGVLAASAGTAFAESTASHAASPDIVSNIPSSHATVRSVRVVARDGVKVDPAVAEAVDRSVPLLTPNADARGIVYNGSQAIIVDFHHINGATVKVASRDLSTSETLTGTLTEEAGHWTFADSSGHTAAIPVAITACDVAVTAVGSGAAYYAPICASNPFAAIGCGLVILVVDGAVCGVPVATGGSYASMNPVTCINSRCVISGDIYTDSGDYAGTTIQFCYYPTPYTRYTYTTGHSCKLYNYQSYDFHQGLRGAGDHSFIIIDNNADPHGVDVNVELGIGGNLSDWVASKCDSTGIDGSICNLRGSSPGFPMMPLA